MLAPSRQSLGGSRKLCSSSFFKLSAATPVGGAAVHSWARLTGGKKECFGRVAHRRMVLALADGSIAATGVPTESALLACTLAPSAASRPACSKSAAAIGLIGAISAGTRGDEL
jgi:hypothetical protein